MNFINLTVWDVAAVSVFVLLNGLLSVWLSLGIERQLIIATVRMVIQLSAIGAVLTLLFSVASLPWTLAMALVMVLFAGREVSARQKRPLKGWWGYGLGTATMTLAAATLTLVALLGSLQPDPWFDPRYAIPLFGMILGNAMTGISLGLDSLTTAAVRERAAIEAHLCLGATRIEALRPAMQEAMRRGFMPMINAMARGRHRVSARHDDRSDIGRHRAWRGRAISATHNVSDRWRHRPRPSFGCARWHLAAH